MWPIAVFAARELPDVAASIFASKAKSKLSWFSAAMPGSSGGSLSSVPAPESCDKENCDAV